MTPPSYSPSSNGQGEIIVKVIKDLLTKNVTGTFKSRLSSILLYYRNTPHSVAGIVPTVTLSNRKYVTLCERVNPNYISSIKNKKVMISVYNIGDHVL